MGNFGEGVNFSFIRYLAKKLFFMFNLSFHVALYKKLTGCIVPGVAWG